MKKTILFFLTMMLSLTSYTQLTLKVDEWVLDIDNLKSVATNEYFMFDVMDEYMVHLVLNEDGSVSDTQFYKIIATRHDEDTDRVTVTVKSGLTGTIYTYQMVEDDNVLYMSKNNGKEEIYCVITNYTPLKTYKQQ